MKKINIRIPIIIILIITLVIMCYFYFKDDNINIDFKNFNSENSLEQNKNKTTNTTRTTTTITTTSQISSALTENIELHATYYFDEIYVEENQFVEKGTKILKYTNGKYLYAPYDCVILNLNIPKEDEQCTNNHYVQISSNNVLQVQLRIDETKISSVSIGDSAKIKVIAVDKEIDGVVTNISNTANNGKFTVIIEFENPSDVMIGMTASISL